MRVSETLFQFSKKTEYLCSPGLNSVNRKCLSYNSIHQNAYHTIPYIKYMEKRLSYNFHTLSKSIEKRFELISRAICYLNQIKQFRDEKKTMFIFRKYNGYYTISINENCITRFFSDGHNKNFSK